MDPKTPSSTETGSVNTNNLESPSPKPSPLKSRYSSPLSSFRNNYKPPPGSPNFKPLGFSSPIAKPAAEVQPIANAQSQPKPLPMVSAEAYFMTEDSPRVGKEALEGRGGEWRGPQQGNMMPDSRRNQRNKPKRFQHSDSPSYRGNHQHRGQNNYRPNNSYGQNNSFGQNNSYGQNNSFGQNNSYGQDNSFGQNNSYGQDNSFGQNRSFGQNSSFNSPNRSNNSFNKRGGGDMSQYYHRSMVEDPWAELVEEKKKRQANQEDSESSDSD